MCGISVVCESGPAPATIDRLRSMHALVAHRGPDGEGWLAVDPDWRITVTRTEDALRHAVGEGPILAAAAFRWLCIQNADPSSNQPMSTAAGDVWALFNGEIYNHDELRRILIAEGRTFRTRSDTETLIVAYQHWGADGFTRLNGMWAAVIVDRRRRSITVSRDRLGIRPLFYRLDAGRVLFGSEAKQLAGMDGGRARADIHAVSGFLSGRRPPPDGTYFTGVRAVPAATHATFPLNGRAPASLEFTPYWRLEPAASRSQAAPSLAEASARLDRLLTDAVGLQSVAAVPVGALLSGGLDSSVLAAVLVDARRRAGQSSSLVSLTPAGATGVLDERPFMHAMATALAGADVTAIESSLDAAGVAASIDRVTWHQEEPLQGVALIGQYHAFRAAADHGVRVVLDGTGADELFGGYPRHQWARLLGHIGDGRWWAGTREFSDAWRRGEAFREWFMEVAALSVRRRFNRWVSADRPAWIHRDLPAPRGLSGLRRGPTSQLSRLSRMTLTDLTIGNVPAVLGIGDRNAMAHSVESRVPYLDHRLVEFAFGLPDQFKTCGGEVKIVLRDVAKRRLPRLVAERRGRIGFGMPIVDWMRQSLRPSILDAVDSADVAASGVFDRTRAQRFVTDFLQGRHQDVGAVWRIYALARWLDVYHVTL